MAEPDKILVWAIRNKKRGKYLSVLEKDKPKYRVPLPDDANPIEAFQAFGQRLANERGGRVTLVLMKELPPGSSEQLKRHFDVPPGRGH
jgi:hypothetical protein